MDCVGVSDRAVLGWRRNGSNARLSTREGQMGDFKRGLAQEFVDELNAMYHQPGSWWRAFVEDKDTFVAIRGNSVNVYYQGASLAKLSLTRNGIVVEVHYKYLVNPDREPEYIAVGVAGTITETDNLIVSEIDVRGLKAAAKNYAGDEKKGVHKIALKPANAVVDLEIAISDGSGAPRMDIASLADDQDGSVRLRFFEAKTYTNPELRAMVPSDIPVVEQISTYSELIRQNKHESNVAIDACARI